MQEEVEQRVVTLAINCTKLTEQELKKTLVKLLQHWKTHQQKGPHGKMTVKQLAAQNRGLQSVEVTDQNIGSFKKIARKYGIDFAPYKAKGQDRYLVFFKAQGIYCENRKTAQSSFRSGKTGTVQGADAVHGREPGEEKGVGTLRKKNWKKILIPNIPYLFIALFATKIGQAVRRAPGTDFSGKALHMMEGVRDAFASPIPSFHPADLGIGICIAAAMRLAVYIKGKNAKKFRHNQEYGSARWGTATDIAPYVDPTFENNMILTQTESLTMNNRPADPRTARNKNVLIIGGSGSGKTRFWLKPNLMQCTSKKYPVSFVVTDPKGSIVTECGKMLLHYGYRLKILNTINFKKSMHYNPFAYIHSEKDILKLVTALIANTKGEGKAGDDFWVKAETLLYTALIGYIHYEAPEEEQNLSTLVEMVNTMEVREDDEEFQNQVDLMFEDLAKEKPEHFAVRQYKKYKLAAGDICSK